MPQRRIFVCTNQKSGVGEDIVKALKKEMKAQGAKNIVYNGEKISTRIQTCNCLDLCKYCKKGPGAALIIYPEGEVYGKVLPKDAPALVQRLAGGSAPAELLLKNQD